MQKKIVAFYIGQLFMILSFFMLMPAGLAIYDADKKAMMAYLLSASLSCFIGLFLRHFSRKEIQHMRITRRESFVIVFIVLISFVVMSASPFLI